MCEVETLSWRSEFGVDSLSRDCWPTIQRESSDCKVYWSGRDHKGRPIIYMRAAKETTFDNKGKKSGNMSNFSIENRHFSGAIHHYLCIFNEKIPPKVGIYIVIRSQVW